MMSNRKLDQPANPGGSDGPSGLRPVAPSMAAGWVAEPRFHSWAEAPLFHVEPSPGLRSPLQFPGRSGP